MYSQSNAAGGDGGRYHNYDRYYNNNNEHTPAPAGAIHHQDEASHQHQQQEHEEEDIALQTWQQQQQQQQQHEQESDYDAVTTTIHNHHHHHQNHPTFEEEEPPPYDEDDDDEEMLVEAAEIAATAAGAAATATTTAPPSPPGFINDPNNNNNATNLLKHQDHHHHHDFHNNDASRNKNNPLVLKSSSSSTTSNRKSSSLSSSSIGGCGSGSGGYIDSSYTMRIHEMLENAEKDNHNHNIVGWLSHGRAFKIHNEPIFVTDIMPRYFKAKLPNFLRWLRAWGFCRMTEGKDRGSWYHRYFVRGCTHLCRNLNRQQMLQAMNDWLPAGQIPNFSGGAGTLSEDPSPNHHETQLCLNNPKRLRGTILEDIRAMLQDAEDENNEYIVSWVCNGKAFKIHDRAKFQKNIMPRYFKANKLTHLSDTLRIWGFQRLKRNKKYKGSYYHKLFVRGNFALCRHRSRQKMKESMAGWSEGEGEELPSSSSSDLLLGNEEVHVSPPAPAAVVTRHENPSAQSLQDTATSTLRDICTAQQSTRIINPSLAPDHILENSFQPQPTKQVQLPPPPAATTLTGNNPYSPQGKIPPLPAVPAPQQNPIFHSTPQQQQQQQQQECKLVDGTYVLRIHEMLEDAEKENFTSIVSWLPHGRAFKIYNDEKFVSDILPRYFKAKIQSFRRWLRAWGFCRMTEGKDRGSWYHRYFVRGVTSLSQNMTRQDFQNAMEEWAGQVPDFYSSGTGGVFSEMGTAEAASNPSLTQDPKKLRGKVPEDLRAMLHDAEVEGNDDIVSWLPHGRAFKVRIKSKFAQQIMPRYFKATKSTYLSDTLRVWGFARLKKGENKGAFFHRLFVKDRPDLTRHLARKQMKEAMLGWPLVVEPDLNSPDVDHVIELGLQAKKLESKAEESQEADVASLLDNKAMDSIDVEGRKTTNQEDQLGNVGVSV